MKIFYDTEFLDNGNTIELISIGLVREDGKEYYAINANMDCAAVGTHPWLVDNVLPHLPGRYVPSTFAANVSGMDDMWEINKDHPYVKTREQIRDEVGDFFVEACIDAGEGDVELWSWYAAYDHVALSQLWGPMVSKPSCVPNYTNDIRQEFQRFGNPKHNVVSGYHNALMDAYYHKRLYEFIKKVGQQQYREAVLEALHPELGYWCDLDNLHKEKN